MNFRLCKYRRPFSQIADDVACLPFGIRIPFHLQQSYFYPTTCLPWYKISKHNWTKKRRNKNEMRKKNIIIKKKPITITFQHMSHVHCLCFRYNFCWETCSFSLIGVVFERKIGWIQEFIKLNWVQILMSKFDTDNTRLWLTWPSSATEKIRQIYTSY